MADDANGAGRTGVVVPIVAGRGRPGVEVQDLPLSDLWRLWWRGPGARFTSKDTRKNYLRCEELSRGLGDYPDPRHVEEWRARLVDAVGLNPRTADMHRYILGSVTRWAHENALTPRNVVGLSRRARPPRAESHPIRNIAEVWPVILGLGKDATERAALGVLRYTGVRIEELSGLMPADVARDCDPWELAILRQRIRDTMETKAPKGDRGRGQRRIPVRPELAGLLLPVLDAWHPVQLRIGTRGGPRGRAESPFLFHYRRRELEELRQRLGDAFPDDFGEGRGLHTFRHTCAFELYTAGVNVATISEWLGHESVMSTEKYLARMAGGRVRSDPALSALFSPPAHPVARATAARRASPAEAPAFALELQGVPRWVCACKHGEEEHGTAGPGERAGDRPCTVCLCPDFFPQYRDKRDGGRSRDRRPPPGSGRPGERPEPF